MTATLQTAQLITNDVLRIAHNNSAFLGNCRTDLQKLYGGAGMKPGQTVYARAPMQFTTRSGATANVQDSNEYTVPLTLNPELGIDFDITDNLLVTAVGNGGSINEDFRERWIKPAGLKLAAAVDSGIINSVYKSIANFAGTPGTPLGTTQAVLDAQAILDDFAVPRDGERMLALAPASMAKLVGAMSGLFNDQKTISEQNKTGLLKTYLGADFMLSQNVPTHTVGPLGGTPVVNGANQGTINAGATDNPRANTTSLVTNGWTAAAAARLKAGDVVTLAGVFAVNPETKASTGNLRQFVVTADVSSDASGNATLILSPAIIAGGAYQNVTTRPANSAAITVVTGTASTAYRQNILWHKDAIQFLSVDMDLPGGMDMAARASYDGLSLRFLRGFDILNNKRISRFDVLYGAALVLPDFAMRVTN
jgi:hypothetical protein